MKTHAIGDLLKVVSPSLVAGYEAKNLLGETLSEVNEEYKGVTQRTGVDFFDWAKLVMFSFLVGLILDGYLCYKDVPKYIALLSMVAIVAPSYLYFIFPARWKERKDRAIRYRCEPILRDFRQAVEALNPLGTNEQYTSDSVWGTLFLLAVRVLEAKDEFIEACKSENPAMVRVQKIIVWEQDCRKRFNHMFEATTKFGLDFSKERIYQAAQDEIDSKK